MKYWNRAWKLVEGCAKVSPGCDHCWSERETAMRTKHPNEKVGGRAAAVMDFVQEMPTGFLGNVICREDNLDLPLRTRKPTVFALWNDIFHEDVPEDFIIRVLNVIDDSIHRSMHGRNVRSGLAGPAHTFLILTKRAERMADVVGRWYQSFVLEGVQPAMDEAPGRLWFGVTAEDQRWADERIPHLLRVPGKRFVSVEPILGPVDLGGEWGSYQNGNHSPLRKTWLDGIHAVIAGGESGKGGRPVHPDWARSLRDQCAAAGVPFTWKQDSGVRPDPVALIDGIHHFGLPWKSQL